jgi:DNA-binding beta-propeller fold protein YncE
LQKFDGQGQFLQKWSSASFNPALTGFRPYGVDVDSHSNLYVADRANPQLLKFNKTGQFLGQWVYPEQLENAVDVAVDSQDNIYAVSSGYLGSGKSSLVKLDSNGKILLQWSEQAAAQLVNPGALSVDKQGNVFVADQGGYHEQGHIFKFDNQGKLLLKWDIPLGNTPVDLAADANGNVYVALAISGNPRLQKYDSQGKLLQEWSAADRPFGQLGGVTVDGQGNVYTLDLSSQFVYKFDANGRFLLKWLGNQATAETGITLGLFPFPAHPAVDKQGRVYVPNANSQYIYAFHQQ